MIGRQLLASVLVGLLVAPAWAAEPFLGTAGPSEAATLRGSSIVPETTLVSGDIVDVGAGGNSVLNLGNGSMVRLSEKTTLRLEKGDNRVAFELLRGRVAFRSSENTPLEAHLSGIRIRSADGRAASGVVAFRSPKLVAITAEQGRLLVSSTRSSRDISLREGETAEMRVDASANGGDTPALGSTPEAVNHHWLALACLAGAVGVVAGIFVAKRENRLTDAQKQALVPVVFPPR